MPRMIAVKMPGVAALSTMCQVFCQRVPPSADDDMRYAAGTALRASIMSEVTVGSTMTANTSEPAKMP